MPVPDPPHLPGPGTAPATPAYLPVPVRADPVPPVRRAQLAVLAAHLTPRDQWILAMVHEHRVLTSTQLLALAFDGERTMRRRLAVLTHRLRVLDRFRPRIPVGSAPEHYVLGPAGAAWLAAAAELTPRQFGYHRNRAHHIAVSAHLAHAVGCNEVFTHIAAAGRRTGPDGGQLAAWWSERRCARLFTDAGIRPDGYGHYTLAPPGEDPDSARNVRFFLEYDTGTEALTRLTGKLPGYARLAAVSRPQPVLFYLPSAVRETHLHQLLDQRPPGIPVATTSPDALTDTAGGPTGAVWRPVQQHGRAARPASRQRLALIDLDALTEPAPRLHTGAAAQAAVPNWWTEPPSPLPPAETGLV